MLLARRTRALVVLQAKSCRYASRRLDGAPIRQRLPELANDGGSSIDGCTRYCGGRASCLTTRSSIERKERLMVR